MKHHVRVFPARDRTQAKARELTGSVLISIMTAPTSTTGDLSCTSEPKLALERWCQR